MGEEEIPDESTILNFRQLLEKHGLTERLWTEVNEYLSENKLLLRAGRIVDAALTTAPCSTKNRDKKRDREMSSTRKGNNSQFGRKVYPVKVTPAGVYDQQEMEALLHGEEKAVFGDKGYFASIDSFNISRIRRDLTKHHKNSKEERQWQTTKPYWLTTKTV